MLGKIAILTQQELTEIVHDAVTLAVAEALKTRDTGRAYTNTQLLTRVQLAKHLQVTPQHISILAKRGLPAFGQGRQKRYRLAEAEAWLMGEQQQKDYRKKEA